jgi:hypothetical protein
MALKIIKTKAPLHMKRGFTKYILSKEKELLSSSQDRSTSFDDYLEIGSDISVQSNFN